MADQAEERICLKMEKMRTQIDAEAKADWLRFVRTEMGDQRVSVFTCV